MLSVEMHDLMQLKKTKALHLPMEGFTGDIQYRGRLTLIPSILAERLQDCSLLRFLCIVAEIFND
jgi:hypothetical protein